MSKALVWKKLYVATPKGDYLVQTCSGSVQDGELCAVLGPSGAGKTTLLSALGGSISSQSGLRIGGQIAYIDEENGTVERLTLDSGHVAWLQQKDNFFSMLTVQETLYLAAFLELPDFSDRERAQRVRTTMDSLGLFKLKDRKIGDAAIHRGLSGGEKRRLSLALELLSSPKLFLADEPTSGLDSTLSEKVARHIKKLAVECKVPCVVSLHQPRSSIWKMLDSVILVGPHGQVCYMGPRKEAIPYFAKLGYKCPTETNPAEFLLDLVSVDSEDPHEGEKDEIRIRTLNSSFEEWQKRSNTLRTWALENQVIIEDGPRIYPSSKSRGLRRLGLLILRAWRQNFRNHHVNAIRLIVSAGVASLLPGIFTSVKKGSFTTKSIADRSGLLSFGVINMAMMTVMKTIDLFAKERPVIIREQQRNQYKSAEYLISKVLAEIPLDAIFSVIFATVLKATTGVRITWAELTATFALMTVTGASLGFAIGSFSPSADVAMSAGVPLMVIFLSVGIISPGGVDTTESPPLLVDILKQFSPIAFAIRAVCVAEFDGMIFEDPETQQRNRLQRMLSAVEDFSRRGGLSLVKTGDQVLKELGLADETYERAMTHLFALAVFNLCISCIGLLNQRYRRT